MNHVCLKLIALGIYKLKNDVFDGFEVKPKTGVFYGFWSLGRAP
jgi:hypothetical protein